MRLQAIYRGVISLRTAHPSPEFTGPVDPHTGGKTDHFIDIAATMVKDESNMKKRPAEEIHTQEDDDESMDGDDPLDIPDELKQGLSEDGQKMMDLMIHFQGLNRKDNKRHFKRFEEYHAEGMRKQEEYTDAKVKALEQRLDGKIEAINRQLASLSNFGGSTAMSSAHSVASSRTTPFAWFNPKPTGQDRWCPTILFVRWVPFNRDPNWREVADSLSISARDVSTLLKDIKDKISEQHSSVIDWEKNNGMYVRFMHSQVAIQLKQPGDAGAAQLLLAEERTKLAGKTIHNHPVKFSLEISPARKPFVQKAMATRDTLRQMGYTSELSNAAEVASIRVDTGPPVKLWWAGTSTTMATTKPEVIGTWTIETGWTLKPDVVAKLDPVTSVENLAAKLK